MIVKTMPTYLIHLSTRFRLSISLNRVLDSPKVFITSSAFLWALCTKSNKKLISCCTPVWKNQVAFSQIGARDWEFSFSDYTNKVAMIWYKWWQHETSMTKFLFHLKDITTLTAEKVHFQNPKHEGRKSFTSKTRKGNVYHSHAGDISEHKLNTDYS